MTPWRILLAAGILLRVVLFFLQSPFNPDEHYEYIQFIGEHHRLPLTHEINQGQHPGFYYLVAALFLPFHSARVIMALSLACSIATLVILYRFLRDLAFAKEPVRCLVFAFFCFWPVLIFKSNFISNDSMAYLFGTLMGVEAVRYIIEPTRRGWVLMALCTGFGLATKLILLTALPLMALVVATRKDMTRSKRLLLPAAFVVLSLVPVSYKFIENARHYGNPLQSWMDFKPQPWWVESQSHTNQGFSSWVDVDVTRLIRHPHELAWIRYSFMLLIYESFWGNHAVPPYGWNPEDSPAREWASSAIFAFAILPTLLFLTGAWFILREFWDLQVRRREAPSTGQEIRLFGLLYFAASLAFLLYNGLRYDLWSCFNSRYLLTSLVGMAVVAAVAWDRAWERKPMKIAGLVSMAGLALAYGLYLVVH